MTDPTPDELHAKMLRKKFWLILSKPVKPADEVRKYLSAHLQSQIALEKAGILFAAGPVSDRNGNPEYGMFIIRANALEEAERVAANDPMHKAGVREYTLHQWSMNEGRVNVTLNFSDKTYDLD